MQRLDFRISHLRVSPGEKKAENELTVLRNHQKRYFLPPPTITYRLPSQPACPVQRYSGVTVALQERYRAFNGGGFRTPHVRVSPGEMEVENELSVVRNARHHH